MVDGLAPIGDQPGPDLLKQIVDQYSHPQMVVATPKRQKIVCPEFSPISLAECRPREAEDNVFRVNSLQYEEVGQEGLDLPRLNISSLWRGPCLFEAHPIVEESHGLFVIHQLPAQLRSVRLSVYDLSHAETDD